MGLTQIKSNTSSSFIQPHLGGLVTVVVDAGIDWLKAGISVHIPSGGIYKIESIIGFLVELRLETAVADEGQIVQVDLLFPIGKTDEGVSTTWGGENGKEW